MHADGFGGCRCCLAGWPGLDSKPFREGDPDASLPVVHHLVSNFKSFVLGTFHDVTRDCLQGYMDEFCWCYRHRRGHSAFGPLLAELLASPKRTKDGLKAVFAPRAAQPATPGWRKRRAARRALCA